MTMTRFSFPNQASIPTERWLAIAYANMPSPLGPLWLAQRPNGLLRASFHVDETEFCADLERIYRAVPEYRPDLLAEPLRQFEDYFAGRRTSFDLDVDLGEYPPFAQAVLKAVMRVPYGTLRSYGDIAREVGRPRAARAVGTVMATNPISLVIPCHRIIRSDGSWGRYDLSLPEAEGTVKRLKLLAIEGVESGSW